MVKAERSEFRQTAFANLRLRFPKSEVTVNVLLRNVEASNGARRPLAPALIVATDFCP